MKFLILCAFSLALAACTPDHARIPPESTLAPTPSRTHTFSPAPTISPTPTAIAPSPSARRSPKSPPTPAPLIEEEDCMAGCHRPDFNDLLAAGAKPLPASHTGRTTCLNCHTTPAAPALHSSHIGRLDPACPVCHKTIAPPK